MRFKRDINFSPSITLSVVQHWNAVVSYPGSAEPSVRYYDCDIHELRNHILATYPEYIEEPEMSMTVQEALKQVMDDLDKMSPEEFLTELKKRRTGDIAIAFAELGSFMEDLQIADPELYKKVTREENRQ